MEVGGTGAKLRRRNTALGDQRQLVVIKLCCDLRRERILTLGFSTDEPAVGVGLWIGPAPELRTQWERWAAWVGNMAGEGRAVGTT